MQPVRGGQPFLALIAAFLPARRPITRQLVMLAPPCRSVPKMPPAISPATKSPCIGTPCTDKTRACSSVRIPSSVLDELKPCQVPAFFRLLNAKRLILPVVEKRQTDFVGMRVEDLHLVLKLLAKSNFFRRKERLRECKQRRTNLTLVVDNTCNLVIV